MAVSCQTFSLGYVLTGYDFDAAIRIAYDDPDGGDKDSQDGVCRVAWQGGYYAASEKPSRLLRSRNSVVGILYLYALSSKGSFTSKCLIYM